MNTGVKITYVGIGIISLFILSDIINMRITVNTYECIGAITACILYIYGDKKNNIWALVASVVIIVTMWIIW